MAWSPDARKEKSMEKSVIERLLKSVFQRIYGEDEVLQMERGIQNVLNKYGKKKELYEVALDSYQNTIVTIFKKLWRNDEKGAEPLLNECIELLCTKSLHPGRQHTPDSCLLLAQLFLKLGDFRLSCEMLWCSASLTIGEFIAKHELKVDLYSHKGKSRFAYKLERNIGQLFSVFENCHSSFYKNDFGLQDVKNAFEDCKEFVGTLREFQLTDEKRKIMEKAKFND